MGEVTLEKHVEARIPGFTFPVHFGGCFTVTFLHEAVAKKMFGTASAEAAHEALHTAMPNEPLPATILIMITIKWVMQIKW